MGLCSNKKNLPSCCLCRLKYEPASNQAHPPSSVDLPHCSFPFSCLPPTSTPQLLCMSPDCLSKLLLGLAHLGLDPGPAWLGLAAAAALEACPRMTGWQAAATVHAFALLGYKVRGGGAYVCVFGGGRNAAFALLGYKAREDGVCVGGGAGIMPLHCWGTESTKSDVGDGAMTIAMLASCPPPCNLSALLPTSSQPPPPSVQPPIGLLHDLADQLQQRMDQLTPGQQALFLQVRVKGGGGGREGGARRGRAAAAAGG